MVSQRVTSIRVACDVFSVSESCYRCEAERNAKNEQIAHWLLRLTDNWGKPMMVAWTETRWKVRSLMPFMWPSMAPAITSAYCLRS